MKLNTPVGRVVYVLSVVASVALVVTFWLAFDQPVIAKVLFTLFALGIDVWNGKLAFGSTPTSAER